MDAILDAVNDCVYIVTLSIEASKAGITTLIATICGVSVIDAAGNSGPTLHTVRNVFLWVMTMAATTINPFFATIITLGNKTTVMPDIAAPGVSIFFAEEVFFHFMSGTSAACPHVSDIVALLKVIHPTWSPTVIKSAIMTSASKLDSSEECIKADDFPEKIADPFDFGSGCINPNKAVDPELIYDISSEEYQKYFGKMCLYFFGPAQPLHFLNLPSVLVENLKTSVIITRIITNVGQIDVIYTALVRSLPGVIMKGSPIKLEFNTSKTKHTFAVILSALHKGQNKFSFGSLTWSDDASHSVTISITII